MRAAALRVTSTAVRDPRPWLRRALRGNGPERETLTVVVRGTVAAAAAWIIAETTLDTEHVAFAPFSALVVASPSIYRSVLQSTRYVAAVFAGVFLAGAVGLGLGLTAASFTLVVALALVLGRARWFGEQARQLPIITSFALAGGNAAHLTDLSNLLVMVCVGVAVAVAVNLVLAPAVRFRDADGAVLALATELHRLLADMADGLARGWAETKPRRWYEAATWFEGMVENARAAVDREEQRVPLNPRTRGLPRTLHGYRGWIATLDRTTTHIQSIIRTLRDAAGEDERHPTPHEEFLRRYAELVRIAADAVRLVTDLDEPERVSTSPELRARVDAGLRRTDALVAEVRDGRFDGIELWPVHGALLTDLKRIFDELYEGHGHGPPYGRDGTR